MKMIIGGNPLVRNEDDTAIYTLHGSMPPLTDFEGVPKMARDKVTSFIENLYFITMEKNGLAYFYPNLETQVNLCRFEWHYEFNGNPYELRLGLSFTVDKDGLNRVGYYITPHEHYKVSESERCEYSLPHEEVEKINLYLASIVNEAYARIVKGQSSTYNALYYVELSSPVKELIYLSASMVLLPSYFLNGKIISAIISSEAGFSYLTAKRFSDEKVNYFCAVIGLVVHKAKLINDPSLPAFLSIIDEKVDFSKIDIEKFYPGGNSDLSGAGEEISKDQWCVINEITKSLKNLHSTKDNKRLKNIIFAYFSAKETESINRAVALVSYVACLDAIANYYSINDDETCPSCGLKKSRNRDLMLNVITKLLGLTESNSNGLNAWLRRIYGEHRSSYVHAANIRFEEYSQDMDGKKFVGLPTALPTASRTVTNQYQYEADFKTLQQVSQALIIKYIEDVCDVVISSFKVPTNIFFNGLSTAEAYVGLINKGWVKIT